MIDFPYPGLRPFKHNEANIFFGRDELSTQLIEKLGDTHFIAVVGPSGCGKSSLVKTGLLAGLNRGFLPNAEDNWNVATSRPGIHPFTNLANALSKDNKPIALEKYVDSFADKEKVPKFLEANLHRGPLSLHNILQQFPLPKATNLLLIIDQFEELFRYHQDGNVDEAAAFVRL
ncbi:hypothetical protein QUF50_07855, partial [Thiotrichales bacterium HSG1]|nr:hypothetical protein [Thiotrichales bacterium HSG1]